MLTRGAGARRTNHDSVGRPAGGPIGGTNHNPAGNSPRDRIDRVSSDDLMSLVAERGSTPMQVGAVLLLDASGGLDPAAAVEDLGRRVAAVPRLRQRLVPVPPGCGRPIWVDDPAFDIHRQITTVRLPDPRSVPAGEPPAGEAQAAGAQAGRTPAGSLPEEAVLDVAAELMRTPLPRDRPLWAGILVTAPAAAQAALIVVFHHVLADGIGGLAVLGSLVDPAPAGAAPPSGSTPFPRPRPSNRQVASDAMRLRLHALRGLPRALTRLAAATGQLRLVGHGRVPRNSLNVPTGPRRRFLSIRMDLATTLAAARARHATVNDILLVVVAGALRRLLAGRGEHLDPVVVSVPFSARQQASAAQLGNASGVIPLRIPASGAPDERVRRVADLTRTAKGTVRGASTAVIAPLFRLLARLGLYRRFIDRQRLIHTFTSNLRGPQQSLAIVACPITGMLPLSAATGNVTVAFAALSYAGTLAVTVVADPDAYPDLPALRQALEEELGALGIAPRRSGRARATG